MFEKSLNQLNYIIDTLPNILLQIDEEEMSEKPLPNKWSKKEVIGHLIDSATNNHQRFVRGQFEHHPKLAYNQNEWNAFNFYQDIESKQLIEFWVSYNKQLIEIIKRIPAENLTKKIQIAENLVTIEFLIVDYVEHLEHHLKQLINY